MTEGGYCKIPRRVRELPCWSTPYHPIQGYLDLVFSACWSDEQQRRGSVLVQVTRGQVLCSQAALARRWGWNRKRIVRFFSSLQAASLIRIENTAARDSGFTLLSILEYDGYPIAITEGGTAGGQRGGQRSGHQEGQRSGHRSEDVKYEESDVCSSAEAAGGTAVGTSGGTSHDPVGGTVNNVLKNEPKTNQGAAAPPPAAKPRRSPKTAAPDGIEITQSMRAWAAEIAPGVDLAAETGKFLDFHRAAGNRFACWTAAWRTWIRRVPEYRRGATGSSQLTRDTVGLADAYRPSARDACPNCEGTGRVLVVTGATGIVARAPWSETRHAALAGPGEQIHTYRCACTAGRKYIHLDPEPAQDIEAIA